MARREEGQLSSTSSDETVIDEQERQRNRTQFFEVISNKGSSLLTYGGFEYTFEAKAKYLLVI